MTAAVAFLLALLAAPGQGAPPARADAVVAADGSGEFTTVQAAIDAVPQGTSAGRRWVIFVKRGTYRELVYVQREKRFVTLLGEESAETVITYNLHAGNPGLDGRPIGTFRTPTVQIDADDFTVENLTFENSAGPVGQALALRVDGDRVVFRNCRFLGWQDTIFLDRGRQYFEDSLIAGHVDFVFGGATAFFERCRLHCWRDGYITAASTPAGQHYGFVFRNGRITGESAGVRTYLGRPWRDFAQVAFLATEMAEVVRPVGWHNWNQPGREKTARYLEAGSTGPGAAASLRAAWTRPLSADEAAALTPETVLAGWNPAGADPSARTATEAPILAPGFTIERVLAELRPRYPQVARVADEAPAGITAREGVVYARRGERTLALDLYRPPGTGPFPAVLIVHGGGWEAGDREMERPLAKRLAARGYVTVPVSYRLGPEGRFPAAVLDLKEAVRWLRAHAAENGIDPARIAAVGASAGGHLAAFLGATNGVAAFDGEGMPGDPESRVQAAVDIDGAASFTDPALIAQEEKAKGATSRFLGGSHAERTTVWRSASPLTHVSAQSAPTLFLESTSPRPILPGRAEMADRLQALGIDAAVVTLPDTPHTFWLVQPWFDRVLEEVDRFLGRHLRPDAGDAPRR